MLERTDIGILEVTCNAPPYPVVEGVDGLGLEGMNIENAKDVRWENVQLEVGGWPGIPAKRATACICKRPLPELKTHDFTFDTQDQVRYDIGQCPHCKTIWWECLGKTDQCD